MSQSTNESAANHQICSPEIANHGDNPTECKTHPPDVHPPDEVFGRGADKLSDFVPTRYEAIELAKHWALVEIRNGMVSRFESRSSCREHCLPLFARRRLDRLAQVLGKDVIHAIEVETRELFLDGWEQGLEGGMRF